jgi:hypothetical protein
MPRQSKKNKPAGGDTANGLLEVDPTRVRFQHSRIRPYFSGCGRSVEATLESIRKGDMSPSDLPPIQVSCSKCMNEQFCCCNCAVKYGANGSESTVISQTNIVILTCVNLCCVTGYCWTAR